VRSVLLGLKTAACSSHAESNMTFTLPQLDPYPAFLEVAPAMGHLKTE